MLVSGSFAQYVASREVGSLRAARATSCGSEVPPPPPEGSICNLELGGDEVDCEGLEGVCASSPVLSLDIIWTLAYRPLSW